MQKKYIIKQADFQQTQSSDFFQNFGPSQTSIDKILQFAACYRSQNIAENHFIALTLN